MATLKELVARFQQAGTTDESSVLTQEELNDPQTRKLAELAKQNVAAETRSAQIEKTREEEAAAEAKQEAEKKEKIATAFGLTSEERARYMQPPKPSVTSLKMPAASQPAPAAPVGTPSDEEKKAADQPPPPSQGGMPPPAGGAPVDATGEPETKQEKLQDSVDSAVFDINKLADKLGANKQISRSTLDGLLTKLEDIKPDVETYKDPATRNFLRDRAEAYKLYKEEADRNQWMELAQSLVNSLTQFASAQAAIGTGRVGGGLPLPSIDYGRRTEQAFREYQAQTADIGAEERSVKEEQGRIDRLRAQDLETRRAGLGARITAERERIQQEESEARQAGRDAITLYNIIQTNKRATEQNQVNVNRAILQYEQKKDKQTESIINNSIEQLEKKQTTLQKQVAAANALQSADKKNYDKALANWATASGQAVQDIVDTADKESGLFTSDKAYVQETLATQHAREAQEQLDTISQQLDQLRAAKSGKQPAPAQKTAASTEATSHNYQAGDIITQGGKKYRYKGGNTQDPKNYEEVK